MDKPGHTIMIAPRRVALSLLGVSLVMLVFSLIGQREYQTGDPLEKFFFDMFTREFFVNGGANIATYWNMLILTIMTVLALLIAFAKSTQKAGSRSGWWFLGLVFLYFAIDEFCGINEKLGALLKDLPNMQVGTYYNWFYPVAAGLIVIISAFLVWFYLHLDAPNRNIFPISMSFYVLGAFRAELFSGYYAELHGKKNMTYLLLSHAEEFVELVGIILMIYLLLTYIAARYAEIDFIPEESKKTA